MKIVVFAYHNTGVIFLKSVLKYREVEILNVYTYKDNAVEGIWFDSVYDFCLDNNVPVKIVKNVNEFTSEIMNSNPDIIFSIGCKNIIGKEILNCPKIGCINFHGSLLPKYRGRTPLNWAILNGEKETGVTAHFMTKNLDDGDIILQEKITIKDDDSMKLILEKLYTAYNRICNNVIKQLHDNSYMSIPQDDLQATVFKQRKPRDGAIVWDKSAKYIKRLVQASSAPYPGSFTFVKNQKLILDSVSISKENYNLESGQIKFIGNKTYVGTGTQTLLLDHGRVNGNIFTQGMITRFIQSKDIFNFNNIINEDILLTNAGTTTSQNIIDALFEICPNIHAVDMNPFCYAKIRLGSRLHVVPPVRKEEEYMAELLKICLEQNIKLIIPCSNDDELLAFTRNRRRFEDSGIIVALPDNKIINKCDNKISANEAALNAGLKVPDIFNSQKSISESDFPVIVKPLRGNGSQGIFVANNHSELKKGSKNLKNYIIQKYIKGPEFTIDICYGCTGEYLSALARRRDAVKDGLCVKTRYFSQHPLINEARKFCEYLGLTGVANVQFINGYFIEMNPRLPGGLGLSMLSGLCLPLILIKIYLNKQVWPEELIAHDGMGLRIWKDIDYDPEVISF